MFNVFRHDVKTGLFFEEQLEKIRTLIFNTEFPTLKAKSLIPINTEGGDWAQTVKWYQKTITGEAKLGNLNSDDAPKVGSEKEEFYHPIKELKASFEYNIGELAVARKEGMNLPSDRATDAREIIARGEDTTLLYGSDEFGIKGFINYPGIPKVEANDQGTGSTTEWINKLSNPQAILDDITAAMARIVDVSKGIEQPNTLLLPVAQYTYLRTTAYGSDKNFTILKWIKENVPELTRIDWVHQLKGAGPGGTDMFRLYDLNPSRVEGNIPQGFNMLPPQERNYGFIVNCYARNGGVQIHRILSLEDTWGI